MATALKPGNRGGPKTIDGYLARLPRDQRAALERLRRAIRAAAPKAEECISYQLRAFRLDGRALVWFGAASRHCSFFPGAPLETFKLDLAAFDTRGKGTIRFQPDHPLPVTLVRRLVKARIARIAARSRAAADAETRRRGRGALRVVPLVAALLLGATTRSFAADPYVGAAVDSSGRLVIHAKSGRTTVLKKEKDQEDFDKIQVSEDGHSVGWLALYPNETTSYPIALRLMVYSGSRLHQFTGTELPISTWRFADGGRQVVFEQETVHGSVGVHYELRDIASGRLVSEWTPDTDQDGHALPDQKPPPWLAELEAKRP